MGQKINLITHKKCKQFFLHIALYYIKFWVTRINIISYSLTEERYILGHFSKYLTGK